MPITPQKPLKRIPKVCPTCKAKVYWNGWNRTRTIRKLQCRNGHYIPIDASNQKEKLAAQAEKEFSDWVWWGQAHANDKPFQGKRWSENHKKW